MSGVRTFALFLCFLGFLSGQQMQEGNFDVRFEPVAKLQTGAQIPIQITVKDGRRQPVSEAKVTLQIETGDHQKSKVFRAPATETGVYLAKPVFPSPGEWTVNVEVRKNDAMTSKTEQYSVPE
jgi:hypothetical protein